MNEKIGDINLEKNNFKKCFIWNLLGTGFNAFNSLFFLIIVTRINGLENAGIFTIAFSTACILYAVGLYSGRIYQVTEQNKTIMPLFTRQNDRNSRYNQRTRDKEDRTVAVEVCPARRGDADNRNGV